MKLEIENNQSKFTNKKICRSLLLRDACLGKGVEEAITRINLQDIHAFRVPQGELLILEIFTYKPRGFFPFNFVSIL